MYICISVKVRTHLRAKLIFKMGMPKDTALIVSLDSMGYTIPLRADYEQNHSLKFVLTRTHN